MIKKNQLLIIGGAIIIIVAIIISISKPKNIAVEDDISPEENIPEEYVAEEVMDVEKQGAVFEYLQKNISQLSPEKEVLGGTFYITSIDFINENSLIVGYEDGHIALTAEVEYNYIDADNIIINNFNIINK
ncbi:MAG: hypothetical protein PHP37_03575 [Patescibacteria group bacterium]|nr:hypothetical protein [Patescibacteria group bacterium]